MRFWGQASVQPGGIREPAVAGTFYPARPDRLAEGVDRYVAQAREEMVARAPGTSPRGVEGPRAAAGGRLVAVVAPHAGHVYSGERKIDKAGQGLAADAPLEVRGKNLKAKAIAHTISFDDPEKKKRTAVG